MSLSRVKIYFENGNLGTVADSDDAVTGLIGTGVAVAGKLELGKAYLITKLDGLTALGITSDEADANANIYKTVKEFYTEAKEGTRLWIMVVANTVTMAQMCDVTGVFAKALINAANGAIRILMISKKDATGYNAVIEHGLDADVYAAKTKAQALAVWATENLYAPLFVILPGQHYSGTPADLSNLHEGTDNRVCILIGDSVTGSVNAAVGLLAGRTASVPVQRSVARTKSGALGIDKLYIASAEAGNDAAELIDSSGFVTFRKFTGKAGYYFTNDKLATVATDDYSLIPRRRVIDKAYRIAYSTLVEELNDEIPVTESGTFPAAIVKSMQNRVESAIENTMGAERNLGADPNNPKDTGVVCFIDHNQNVVSTSKFEVRLRVKPYGYPKYIDVYLGFTAITA